MLPASLTTREQGDYLIRPLEGRTSKMPSKNGMDLRFQSVRGKRTEDGMKQRRLLLHCPWESFWPHSNRRPERKSRPLRGLTSLVGAAVDVRTAEIIHMSLAFNNLFNAQISNLIGKSCGCTRNSSMHPLEEYSCRGQNISKVPYSPNNHDSHVTHLDGV